MDRRTFLLGTAALGGGLALGGRWPARAAGRRPGYTSILEHPASDCPVDTIVVLCMENRSFDHYFGWLATDETFLEDGRRRYGHRFRVEGSQDLEYVRADGTTGRTFHLPDWTDTSNPYRGCGGHPDPAHGWTSGRVQRDLGFVADGSGNDDFAIGFYREAELPLYAQLVRHHTLFDHYHCSLMASTFPNREYLHSGQSGGHRDNEQPSVNDLGFQWPTIWDRLMAANVPAGMYGVDVPTTALWGARLLGITHPIARLFADAQAGTLPQVTFIDPGFISGMRTDDHPHGDMRIGQRFAASILDALQRSPQWGQMAVFTTYDEWGGFFDHVAPPVLPDDLGSTNDEDNYGQTGFRLPVTLASPFAQPGFVDHRVYDHTSILRFIEWRFLGAPPEGPDGNGWWLTTRDRYANNIGAALVDQRVNDFEIDTSVVPLVLSTPCNGQAFQDVPGLSDVEDAVVPVLNQAGVDFDDVPLEATVPLDDAPSPFELARDAGIFERFGYDTEPSLSLSELLAGAGR